jgi:hypothetical protein
MPGSAIAARMASCDAPSHEASADGASPGAPAGAEPTAAPATAAEAGSAEPAPGDAAPAMAPDDAAAEATDPGLGSLSLVEAMYELEMQLDQLVISGTKTAQRMTQVPAVVTVISAEEIQARGYTSLAEVLRTVPGFYDVYDLATHNFGIRGINGGARAERLATQAADRRPGGHLPPEHRQLLRRGAHPARGRRADRGHPRPGFRALQRQRLPRRRQRDHALGRVGLRLPGDRPRRPRAQPPVGRRRADARRLSATRAKCSSPPA